MKDHGNILEGALICDVDNSDYLIYECLSGKLVGIIKAVNIDTMGLGGGFIPYPMGMDMEKPSTRKKLYRVFFEIAPLNRSEVFNETRNVDNATTDRMIRVAERVIQMMGPAKRSTDLGIYRTPELALNAVVAKYNEVTKHASN